MSSFPAGIKETIISPPLMYFCGGVMKIIMVLGNGKQMCFLSMVLYGDWIKNVNGRDLIQLTSFLGIPQISVRTVPTTMKLPYCSKYIEI